jgi:hypothetical protein
MPAAWKIRHKLVFKTSENQIEQRKAKNRPAAPNDGAVRSCCDKDRSESEAAARLLEMVNVGT